MFQDLEGKIGHRSLRQNCSALWRDSLVFQDLAEKIGEKEKKYSQVFQELEGTIEGREMKHTQLFLDLV